MSIDINLPVGCQARLPLAPKMKSAPRRATALKTGALGCGQS